MRNNGNQIDIHVALVFVFVQGNNILRVVVQVNIKELCRTSLKSINLRKVVTRIYSHKHNKKYVNKKLPISLNIEKYQLKIMYIQHGDRICCEDNR